MPQILYSDPKSDGTVDYWMTERLWRLAKELPVRKRMVSDLPGLDEVLWFGGPKLVEPTCRAVADHVRQIVDADLSYPVILSADGEVWDGMHRLAKAYLEGITEIDTVQFPSDPSPDGTIEAGHQRGDT